MGAGAVTQKIKPPPAAPVQFPAVPLPTQLPPNAQGKGAPTWETWRGLLGPGFGSA